MSDQFAAALMLIVGLLLAIYGIRGALRRRITIFGRGRLPRAGEGAEAVSAGFIYATFGLGFVGLGALLLLTSSNL